MPAKKTMVSGQAVHLGFFRLMLQLLLEHIEHERDFVGKLVTA